MTGKRTILVFWALFLLPALILWAVAFRLLSHEQERLSRTTVNALADRTRAVCQSLHITLETIQDKLTRSLMDIESGREKEILIRWEQRNPLVRNVFVFIPGKGLSHPPPGQAATPEEQQFKARYHSFFSGRMPFDFNQIPSGKEGGRQPAEEPRGLNPYGSLGREGRSPFPSALSSLSKSIESQKMGGAKKPAKEGGGRWGWIPWFSENRLYIMGWAAPRPGGPVFGLELEWMTILSRMVVDFPRLDREGAALVLMDGAGRAIHKSGPLDTNEGDRPVMEISVSSLLPHWRVGIFLDEKLAGTGKQFFLVSMMILGLLITAMVYAGIMLTRLAFAKIRDARQKTSFVASVSHELKTPLTSIRMYAELMLEGRVRDREKKGAYLKVIVDESARLTRLINNVLDFGKLEQQTKTYTFSRFLADEFLKGLIGAHGIRIKGAGLEVICDISPGNYGIRTDRDALEQVVLNLVDNVLKYAGKGRFIRFGLTPSDGGVVIRIQDDGPGIQKAHRDRIFERFYRIDDSLTAARPGSGLGLSISKRILQDLGGDLILEPSTAKGACFAMEVKNHEPA